MSDLFLLSTNRRQLSRWLLPLTVFLLLTAATFAAWQWQSRVQREAAELSGSQESTATVTHDVAMSGPIVLLADQASRRSAFLMAHALYRAGLPLENANQRQLAFGGAVLTAYRTDVFFCHSNMVIKAAARYKSSTKV